MQILLFSKGLEGLKKCSSGVKVPGTMEKAGKGTREVREWPRRPGRVRAVQISFQTSDTKPTLKAWCIRVRLSLAVLLKHQSGCHADTILKQTGNGNPTGGYCTGPGRDDRGLGWAGPGWRQSRCMQTGMSKWSIVTAGLTLSAVSSDKALSTHWLMGSSWQPYEISTFIFSSRGNWGPERLGNFLMTTQLGGGRGRLWTESAGFQGPLTTRLLLQQPGPRTWAGVVRGRKIRKASRLQAWATGPVVELFIERAEWRKGPAKGGRAGWLGVEGPSVQELCPGLGEAQMPSSRVPHPSSAPCRAVSAGGQWTEEARATVPGLHDPPSPNVWAPQGPFIKER